MSLSCSCWAVGGSQGDGTPVLPVLQVFKVRPHVLFVPFLSALLATPPSPSLPVPSFPGFLPSSFLPILSQLSFNLTTIRGRKHLVTNISIYNGSNYVLLGKHWQEESAWGGDEEPRAWGTVGSCMTLDKTLRCISVSPFANRGYREPQLTGLVGCSSPNTGKSGETGVPVPWKGDSPACMMCRKIWTTMTPPSGHHQQRGPGSGTTEGKPTLEPRPGVQTYGLCSLC